MVVPLTANVFPATHLLAGMRPRVRWGCIDEHGRLSRRSCDHTSRPCRALRSPHKPRLPLDHAHHPLLPLDACGRKYRPSVGLWRTAVPATLSPTGRHVGVLCALLSTLTVAVRRPVGSLVGGRPRAYLLESLDRLDSRAIKASCSRSRTRRALLWTSSRSWPPSASRISSISPPSTCTHRSGQRRGAPRCPPHEGTAARPARSKPWVCDPTNGTALPLHPLMQGRAPPPEPRFPAFRCGAGFTGGDQRVAGI